MMESKSLYLSTIVLQEYFKKMTLLMSPVAVSHNKTRHRHTRVHSIHLQHEKAPVLLCHGTRICKMKGSVILHHPFYSLYQACWDFWLKLYIKVSLQVAGLNLAVTLVEHDFSI